MALLPHVLAAYWLGYLLKQVPIHSSEDLSLVAEIVSSRLANSEH